jgi:quinol monooxygenase YgiN
MIHVIAAIELKPGTRDAFLREFHALMPSVHAEDGCIEYGPTVDAETPIAAQVPRRPDLVTIVEKWRDVPALQAHLVAPHMTPYRAKVKEFVISTQLQILEPA